MLLSYYKFLSCHLINKLLDKVMVSPFMFVKFNTNENEQTNSTKPLVSYFRRPLIVLYKISRGNQHNYWTAPSKKKIDIDLCE